MLGRLPRIAWQAVLAVLSGALLAYVLSALVLFVWQPTNGQLGDIGYAIFAVLIGYPLGVWLGTVLWGSVLALRGSKTWSLLGLGFGVLLLLVLSISPLMAIAPLMALLFVSIFPLLIIGGYHYSTRSEHRA